MEYNKQRIEWIDTARGMLIILVVLGHNHINTLFGMLINSFHMAAFFMLSGFTLKVSEQMGTFIWKKCKRLLFPYYVFALIMLAYQFTKTLIFPDTVFDLRSGLVSIFIVIGGRETTTTYGLWFLPCLFLAEIAAFFIVKVWDRTKVMASSIFLVVVALGEGFFSLSSKSSIVAILPIATTFIILGQIFRREMQILIERKKILFSYSCIMFLAFLSANSMYCKHVLAIDAVDLSHMRLGFWPLFMLSSFFGSLMICEFAMMVKNGKFLASLGRESLYYYGLHYEVVGIIGKIVPGAILQTVVTFAALYMVIRWYKKGYSFLGRIRNDQRNSTSL